MAKMNIPKFNKFSGRPGNRLPVVAFAAAAAALPFPVPQECGRIMDAVKREQAKAVARRRWGRGSKQEAAFSSSRNKRWHFTSNMQQQFCFTKRPYVPISDPPPPFIRSESPIGELYHTRWGDNHLAVLVCMAQGLQQLG